MGIATNGTNQYFHPGAALAGLASGTTKASHGGWAYRSAAGTTWGCGRYQNLHRFSLLWYSDNVFYVSAQAGADSFGYTAAIATAGWHHVFAVYDGTASGNANRLKFYYDGAAQSLTFSGTIPASLSTNSVYAFGIDAVGAGLRYWAGAYAEFGVWSGKLIAQDDITDLAKGSRPDAIYPKPTYYWPLTGDGIGQIEPDYYGRQEANTWINSAAQSSHPRVRQPNQRKRR